MTLPSRLEIVEEFANPPREPAQSQPGRSGREMRP
jgi:hypothetical protein